MWYDLRDKVVCDESTVVPNTNSTVLLLLDYPSHPENRIQGSLSALSSHHVH